MKLQVAFVTVLILLMLLSACGDDQYERMQHQSEIAARISAACTPYPDERRIVEWAVDEAGETFLSVSVMKFDSRRQGAQHYNVMSLQEINQ